MTENQKRLIEILKDMFQFEQADLDFGIYRIMNLKRKEISNYLEKSLIQQITEGINSLVDTENEAKIKELKSQIEATKALAISQIAKDQAVAELEKQLNSLKTTDISDIEGDVYNHLINFFSRYYDEGDFISQRRYKDGVYAIPYEGEEVKLYWANADQYYVKTTEYFNDYTFKTMYGKTVMFKVVEAEVERDNNKANDKRFFCIHEEKPYEILDGQLVIYVEYRNADFKKQEESNKIIYETLKKNVTDSEFLSIFVAPSSKEKSEFEKQLFRYTAKNTYDYFIHKDLGKFLRRELDFYIKNEVIFLDDIQVTDMAKTKEYLVKAQVIKAVANKLIDFLAQIEDFQKKMYLKKKFVVDTQYCITLDRVPEEMYPEIIANDAQREEWVKLFAIDEIKEQQGSILEEGKVGYSVPLTIEFLKQNPFLVLDTAFFSDDFKEKLVESIDDLDERTNGLMINSDNYQVLNLLKNKFKGVIDAIYIDPPYNAPKSEIIYKNNYKNSSWLSLICQRLEASRVLLKNDGVTTVAIDDYEMPKLWELMNDIYGYNNHLGTVTVRINPKGRMTERKISAVHEFLLMFGNGENAYIKKLPVNPEEKTHNYKQDENGVWYLPNNLRKQGVDSEAERGDGTLKERYFPIYYDPQSGQVSSKEKLPIEIWPIDESGYKRIWRRGFDAIDEMYEKGEIWINKIKGQYQVYYKFFGGLDGKMIQSMWTEAECSASDYGTKILDNILGQRELFSYPKAPFAVRQSILAMEDNKNGLIMDYFAGSGTTGHATIQLNRKDNGNRKFILCEMGDYFNSVTRPRIEKVIYSDNWQNGTPLDNNGVSFSFKYHHIESYEDTLNNIKFDERLEFLPDDMKEEYILKYMLENDANESMFNVKALEHPFNYAMSITRKQEAKWTNIDLVETFNYLIGLIVERNYAKSSYDATFSNGEYGVLKANITKGNTYIVKLIEGHSLSGDKVLVVWRDMTGDIVKDNAVLDAVLAKKKINSTDNEYDRIYVNGDNNLPNTNGNKVILIEDEMQKRMFEE